MQFGRFPRSQQLYLFIVSIFSRDAQKRPTVALVGAEKFIKNVKLWTTVRNWKNTHTETQNSNVPRFKAHYTWKRWKSCNCLQFPRHRSTYSSPFPQTHFFVCALLCEALFHYFTEPIFFVLACDTHSFVYCQFRYYFIFVLTIPNESLSLSRVIRFTSKFPIVIMPCVTLHSKWWNMFQSLDLGGNV